MNHAYFDGIREKEEMRPITAKLDASKSKPAFRPNNFASGDPNLYPPAQPLMQPTSIPPQKTRGLGRKEEGRLPAGQSPGSVEKGRSSSKFGKLPKDGSAFPQTSIVVSLME